MIALRRRALVALLPPFLSTATVRASTSVVSVQHRFGGALNHIHAAVIDGVFTRDHEGERATFQAVPPPDSFALGEVIERVYERLVAWLRANGLLAECDHERAAPTDPSAMDACVSASLSQKGLVRLDARGHFRTPVGARRIR